MIRLVGLILGATALAVVTGGVVAAGAITYGLITVAALTPHASVHPECARYAGRVCDTCRPHFGYQHPTPAHPTPGATR